MQIGRVENATRVVGKTQGYLGLPIRDEVQNCSVGGRVPLMVTAWYPTMEELQALIDGAPIHLNLQGTQHPPVNISVGETPEKTEN